jgi:hypothetical protein
MQKDARLLCGAVFRGAFSIKVDPRAAKRRYFNGELSSKKRTMALPGRRSARFEGKTGWTDPAKIAEDAGHTGCFRFTGAKFDLSKERNKATQLKRTREEMLLTQAREELIGAAAVDFLVAFR